jgi:multidrug efflux pump subunit AcrA (membrane-fusion protein)
VSELDVVELATYHNMLKPVSTFLLCVSLTIISISCGSSGGAEGGGRRSGGNSNADSEQNAPVAITVARSEARDIPATIQATGSFVANETSNVAPRAAGKIANISVNAGDFVSGGQIIARIDDRDARLQLANAQAAVKQAQAGVRQAEARLGLLDGGRFEASTIPEVRVASANLEQMQAELRQAEANEARYRELTRTGDVAMVAYETHRTARDTARARVNAARQQLDAAINTARQSNQAIVSARANVEAAQTQVAQAQQAIADTIVRAPFAGFVSERPAAVGEYVSSASIIATVLRTNPIKIQIQVGETDLPFVGLGRGVSVEVDAYRDRRFAGSVIAVNPAVDPNSRSAVVEASIENGDNALRPGMFGSARINREGGGVGIFIPKAAVHSDEPTQSYRAFVIVEGVAKLRVLQLGPEEGDSIQILSGLNADEVVATSNLDQLYEGAKVVF